MENGDAGRLVAGSESPVSYYERARLGQPVDKLGRTIWFPRVLGAAQVQHMTDFVPATWVELPEAVRTIVRLAPDGGKLAIFMTHERWAFWDHPTSIKAHYGADAVPLFRQAQEAWRAASTALTDALQAGKIAGEGFDQQCRARRMIEPQDWATRYIHLWKSELQPPIGAQPEFPVISAVRVKTDDVIREFREGHAIAPQRGGRPHAVDWEIVEQETIKQMAHHGDFSPADSEPTPSHPS